jgi:hypothetical protein
VAQGSTARRSTIGDEVHDISNPMAKATRRYIDTSMETTGKGSSLEQWSVQQWCSASKWISGFMVDKNLSAWLPSCMGTPQA